MYFKKETNFNKKVTSSCYPQGYTIGIPQIDFKSVCSNGFVLNDQYSFTIKDSEWSNVSLFKNLIIISSFYFTFRLKFTLLMEIQIMKSVNKM